MTAMPVYRVRLEAQDSQHYRVTDIQAPDEATAEAWCVLREHKKVAFRLDDDEVAELEAKRAAGEDPDDPTPPIGGRDKGRLLTHEQRLPYKVVSVEEKDTATRVATSTGGEE
jgi:hypothetical protein